jgi:hypothetical protein
VAGLGGFRWACVFKPERLPRMHYGEFIGLVARRNLQAKSVPENPFCDYLTNLESLTEMTFRFRYCRQY